MIVLDPVYRPEKPPSDFERKYELIYAEGIISNYDYIKGGRFKVNQRRPFEQHYPKDRKQEKTFKIKAAGRSGQQKPLFNFYDPAGSQYQSPARKTAIRKGMDKIHSTPQLLGSPTHLQKFEKYGDGMLMEYLSQFKSSSDPPIPLPRNSFLLKTSTVDLLIDILTHKAGQKPEFGELATNLLLRISTSIYRNTQDSVP